MCILPLILFLNYFIVLFFGSYSYYLWQDYDGRQLTVNKASPRGAQPERPPRRNFEPAASIYVGNLPWDIDSTRLEQVFSEHGKVVSARVVYDRDSGRSRGFGFVTMSTETEMNDAVAALDGQVLLKFLVKLSMVTFIDN